MGIGAILRNSFLETVRQPVYGLVLALSCLLITLIPISATSIYVFTAGTGLERVPERMVADLGLATVQLAGLILAVFMTGSVISREIEDRTAATVLSKPVGRVGFILGKFLGVGLAITFATGAAAAVTLLTIRVGSPLGHEDPIDWGVFGSLLLAAGLAISYATFRSYVHGRAWIGSFNLAFLILIAGLILVFGLFDRDYKFVFSPTYSHASHGHAHPEEAKHIFTYDWDVFRAAVLTIESVLVMVSVSVAVSTRLSTLGNGAVTGLIFVLGVTSDLASGFLARQAWAPLAELYRGLLPALQRFWMSDALVREQAIPLDYVLLSSGYAALYIGASLMLACALFADREIA